MTTMALLGFETSARRAAPLVFEETYWGYTVGEATDRFETETVLEAACRFLGLILVICAYAQWLLPGSMYGPEVFGMKAALSFLFGASGVVIYWFASRGARVELEVDQARRELRVVSRNSRGQTRLQRRVAMNDVRSAFVRRPTGSARNAELVVRLRRNDGLVTIASGRESDLSELHARLRGDIRPVTERVKTRTLRPAPEVRRRAIRVAE